MSPPPPAGAAPGASGQAAAGTWYYCESSKSYYPYVSSCSEGWRSVPASPPPARECGGAALTDGPSHEQREHDLTLHVFLISAAMVWICTIIAYTLA
jgi:hypothetical protein